MKPLETYLTEADTALDAGQLQAAHNIYKETLTHYPDSDDALMMLGSVYAELGNVESAVKNLNQALLINKSNSTAYVLLAHIYKATNDNTRLYDTLESGVKNCAEDVELILMLSDFLIEEKDYPAVIKHLQDAYNIKPDDINTIGKLGYTYQMMGNLEDANKYYKLSYDLDDTNVTTLCGLIDSYAKLGDDKEAMTTAEAGIKLYPDDINVIHFYAMALLASKRFNEAHIAIDQAINAQPDSLAHQLLKADIYERSGDYERAFDIIKVYLEAEPPLLEAILVFARFCINIEMVDECISLLLKTKDDPNNQNNIVVIDDAIAWLKNNSQRKKH